MGGRGRGRGAKMSFTIEQMGLTAGEALPAPVLQPPPHYPLLEYYPALMDIQSYHTEQLRHKTSLLTHFSRYKACLTLRGPSTAYKVDDQQDDVSDMRLNFDWSRFPAELRPNATKKRKSTIQPGNSKEKVARVKNIDALLDELEKREEVTVKKEVEEGEGDKEGEEEEEIEEEVDQEMDEGTDYNQNYFDNGENYLDEDEDGDDDPIY